MTAEPSRDLKRNRSVKSRTERLARHRDRAVEQRNATHETMRKLADQWESDASAIEDTLPADDADYSAPSQDRDYATARTLRDCARELRQALNN